MKAKLLIAFLTLLMSTGYSQDMGFDPTSPQGSDYIGFKSKIATINGNTAMKTTMAIVCVEGQAVLNTTGLTFDSNSQYYITPNILTMEIKDISNGNVLASQVVNQWHIVNSSQINYSDALRLADTIAWQGFTDPNLPPLDGTTLAPEMTEGYMNGFTGANEEIPVYITLPIGFASGVYEFCATGDFSYFFNESNDPNEFPDSWCYAISVDMVTGVINKVSYPNPPAPIVAADVTYSSGSDPVVAWDGDAESYDIEPYVKKGNRSKGLNPVSVVGNSYVDHMMKSAPQLLFGTERGVKFYYKIRPDNNGIKGEWIKTKDKKF